MTGPKACRKCGQPHDRCTAHNRHGLPCQQRPRVGQTVCKAHGGNAPQALAKAAVTVLEEKARGMLPASFPPHADPIGELLSTFSEVVAFRDALRSMVTDMQSIRYRTEGGEQLRAEVAAYERALDRVVSTGEKLARLDLDARLARMQEVHLGPRIVAVLQSVFDDPRLGLSEGQRAVLGPLVSEKLRALGDAA